MYIFLTTIILVPVWVLLIIVFIMSVSSVKFYYRGRKEGEMQYKLMVRHRLLQYAEDNDEDYVELMQNILP